MANILVVDDEVEITNLIAGVLKKEKHSVTTASDGQIGLDCYTKNLNDSSSKFHLIITDIMMPKKDGIDLILDILSFGSIVPIIAMSGGKRSVSTEFNLKSAEYFGVKSLEKPFSVQELISAVNDALGINS